MTKFEPGVVYAYYDEYALFLGYANHGGKTLPCWHLLPAIVEDLKQVMDDLRAWSPLTFATYSSRFTKPSNVRVPPPDLSKVMELVSGPYDRHALHDFSWVTDGTT